MRSRLLGFMLMAGWLIASVGPACAQTTETQTQCRPGYTKDSLNCTSTTTQPQQPSQIQPPNVGDAFLRGRDLAIREQELQLQREMMNAQLQAQERRLQVSRAGAAATSADVAQLQALVEEKEARERSVRQDYWFQQVEACIRQEQRGGMKSDECTDKLLLTDPNFARANIEGRESRKAFAAEVAEQVKSGSAPAQKTP